MSWHYLRGQEVESWQAEFSDGEPDALSRLMPMPGPFSLPDKQMEHSVDSQSGMTSEHSMGTDGGDQLTLFLEGSHARESVRRVKSQDLPTSVLGFGSRCSESLQRLGLLLSSRKTVRTFVPMGLVSSSRDLSAWGMTSDGGCWELGTLVRHISETDSGLLPTPTASQYGTRNNGRRGDGTEFKTKGSLSLNSMAATGLWPTPTAACATGGQRSRSGKRKNELLLGGIAGGPLNPAWVEWLMGWPIGHTDLDA